MRSLKCQSYFLLFIEYFLSVVLQQQYFMDQRMIKVLSRLDQDLMNTSLSITDIAEKHGFSSVHYLSRLFRQLNGTTPRQYREARDESNVDNISSSYRDRIDR